MGPVTYDRARWWLHAYARWNGELLEAGHRLVFLDGNRWAIVAPGGTMVPIDEMQAIEELRLLVTSPIHPLPEEAAVIVTALLDRLRTGSADTTARRIDDLAEWVFRGLPLPARFDGGQWKRGDEVVSRADVIAELTALAKPRADEVALGLALTLVEQAERPPGN